MGVTQPKWSIGGGRTRLQIGHGLAVAADGSLYALAAGRGGNAILLHFANGASGNAAPVGTYAFPSGVANDFSNGLFVDDNGRIWLADGVRGRVSAYRANGKKLELVESITPSIATPFGPQSAGPHGIFLDPTGHLYCVVNYLYHGANFVGISEYDVASVRPKLLRSFYDPDMPFDVPPDAIAIDGKGYIYLANTHNLDGIFIYPPGWTTGPLTVDRVLGRGAHRFSTGYIASLAALADGTLYVAMGDSNRVTSSIAVYAPGASGHPKPERVVRNRQFIQYPEGNFGTLLVVR